MVVIGLMIDLIFNILIKAIYYCYKLIFTLLDNFQYNELSLQFYAFMDMKTSLWKGVHRLHQMANGIHGIILYIYNIIYII